jgi:hypothetical protein
VGEQVARRRKAALLASSFMAWHVQVGPAGSTLPVYNSLIGSCHSVLVQPVSVEEGLLQGCSLSWLPCKVLTPRCLRLVCWLELFISRVSCPAVQVHVFTTSRWC